MDGIMYRYLSRCVGIGRRDRLKLCCPPGRVGSSPTTGTITFLKTLILQYLKVTVNKKVTNGLAISFLFKILINVSF